MRTYGGEGTQKTLEKAYDTPEFHLAIIVSLSLDTG